VDGQRRLTTLSLALAAVRDHIAAADAESRDRINDLYLVNRASVVPLHCDLHGKPNSTDAASYDRVLADTHDAVLIDLKS
jgi:hypothetical protein